MAEHLWYILLKQKQYGPYTFQDLKGISSVTPDTLCWREGMEGWKPIRDVHELKDLFKDDEPVPEEEEISTTVPSEDLALTLSPSEPPYYLWLILLLLVILYVFFQFN